MHARFLPRCLGIFLGGWLLAHAAATTAADPSRWEKEISGLETRMHATPRAAHPVLFYGSSSFRLWTNLAAAFPQYAVVNHGFGGSELSDQQAFIDRLVVPVQPSVLLIYGGDNDLASKKTAERVRDDFAQLVEMVHARLPKVRIAFVAVKPSPSRAALLGEQQRANALVRAYTRHQRRVDFLDVATPLLGKDGQPDPRFFIADRLHLNGDGYEVWRQVIAPYLKRWAKRQE